MLIAFVLAAQVAPFHLIGNIHYVGDDNVGIYLITTPAGHLLLDGGGRDNAPQVEANIEKLGFHLRDVKILLNSHGHFDHAGALAELKRRSGAQMVASVEEKPLLEAGGRGDFRYGDTLAYEPVKVDRVVHDGERVELGGVALVANLTPGHTRGCTSWTMDFAGHRAVFVCSLSRLDYKLVGNDKYPQIADDFRASFRKLRELKPDVFLGAHAGFFGGPHKSDFVDPAGYMKYIDDCERDFLAELARQQR